MYIKKYITALSVDTRVYLCGHPIVLPFANPTIKTNAYSRAHKSVHSTRTTPKTMVTKDDEYQEKRVEVGQG